MAVERFLFQAGRQQLNGLTHTPSITAELHKALFTQSVNQQLRILPLRPKTSKLLQKNILFACENKTSTFCYYLSLFIKGLLPSLGWLSQYFDQALLHYLLLLNFNLPRHFAPIAQDSNPGQEQELRNLPGQPRKEVEMLWDMANAPDVVFMASGIKAGAEFLFQRYRLRSNTAPSMITTHVTGFRSMEVFLAQMCFPHWLSIKGMVFKAQSASQPFGQQLQGTLSWRGFWFKVPYMTQNVLKSCIFAKQTSDCINFQTRASVVPSTDGMETVFAEVFRTNKWCAGTADDKSTVLGRPGKSLLLLPVTSNTL